LEEEVAVSEKNLGTQWVEALEPYEEVEFGDAEYATYVAVDDEWFSRIVQVVDKAREWAFTVLENAGYLEWRVTVNAEGREVRTPWTPSGRMNAFLRDRRLWAKAGIDLQEKNFSQETEVFFYLTVLNLPGETLDELAERVKTDSTDLMTIYRLGIVLYNNPKDFKYFGQWAYV